MKKQKLLLLALFSLGIVNPSFAEIANGECSQSPSEGRYDACTNSEGSCLSKAEYDANVSARARCKPQTAENIVVVNKRSEIKSYPGTSARWWSCGVQVRYTCSH